MKNMKKQLFQLCLLLLIVNKIYGAAPTDEENEVFDNEIDDLLNENNLNKLNSDDYVNEGELLNVNLDNRILIDDDLIHNVEVGVKSVSDAESFSYNRNSPNGPQYWSKFSDQCVGSQQSPINLKYQQAIHQNGRLKFTGIYNKPLQVTYSNDGHTIRLSFTWKNGPPTLTGGPLAKSIYRFEQLHFHFGSNNAVGSEHHVNGHTYPMELHLVFSNTKYANFSEAIKYSDGATVVARFYDIVNNVDSYYEFTRYINAVTRADSTFSIYAPNTFTLASIMKSTSWNFYTYKGSLTTPNCNEAVTWIVSTETLPITILDMTKFRALLGNDGLMSNNFRPLQRLNGRKVYYYKLQ